MLWTFLAVAVAMMILTLVVATRFAVLQAGVEKDPFLLFCIAVGVMINEGIPNRLLSIKTTPSLQILISSWVPMALLLGMAYQTNLLASLVKVGKENPIDTYQDLIDQNVAIHMSKDVLSWHLLSTSPIPLVRKAFTQQVSYYNMVKGTVPPFVFESTAEGTGTYDTIVPRYFGFRHRFRRGKHLDIGIFGITYYHGINHPLADQVNPIICKMIDSGIFIGLMRKFNWLDSAIERKFYRSQAPIPLWKSLKVTAVVPAFLICAAVLSVALLIFALETMKEFCKV